MQVRSIREATHQVTPKLPAQFFQVEPIDLGNFNSEILYPDSAE